MFGKVANFVFSVGVAVTFLAPAATARPQACSTLEAEFVRLSKQADSRPQRSALSGAYAQQIETIRLTRQKAQRLGCGSEYAPAQQCNALAARLADMQANLDYLEDERDRAVRSGSVQARLEAVRQSLIDLNCSGRAPATPPQVYEANSNPTDRGYQVPGSQLPPVGAPQHSVPIDERPSYMRPDVQPLSPQPSRSSATVRQQDGGQLYTSYCVRTCDGYYFPVSKATPQAHLDEDVALCQTMCPGTETQLYIHGPQEGIDQLRTPGGTPYTALPTAYSFKEGSAASCTCNGSMNLPKAEDIQEASLPPLDGTSAAPDFSSGSVPATGEHLPKTLFDAPTADKEIQESGAKDLATQSQQDEVENQGTASESVATQTTTPHSQNETARNERPAPRKVAPKTGPVRQVGPKFFADQ